jgi:hypothetical protein
MAEGGGCQEFGSWNAECGKQEKVQGIKERYKTEGIRFKVKVNRENPIQFVFIPVLVLVIRNFSRTRDEYDDEGRACRAEVITKAAAGPINPKSQIRNPQSRASDLLRFELGLLI